MSLRSIGLNRPLRNRSSLTRSATSKLAALSCAEEKGTTAIGIARDCPRVISTTNSARAAQQMSGNTRHRKILKDLVIGLELEDDDSVEQGGIRRIGQR